MIQLWMTLGSGAVFKTDATLERPHRVSAMCAALLLSGLSVLPICAAAQTLSARDAGTRVGASVHNSEATGTDLGGQGTARVSARPATPAAKPTAAVQNQPIANRQVASLSPATSRVDTSSATSRPIPAAALPLPTATRTTPVQTPGKILINASEPTPAPSVRPADVQGFQKIGAPYQVNGTWYIPAHEPNYDEVGVASWYGRDFHGRVTANGELFDMNIATAAHPTLPIPSLVEVTNLENGRSMVVRVNDRGPFVGGRLIDLSSRAAELLGYKEKGSTQVRVRYVGPADPVPVVTADTLTPASEEKKWSQPVTGPVAPQPRVQSQTLQAAPVARPATPASAPATLAQALAPAQRQTASNSATSGPFVQAGAFGLRDNAMRRLAEVASYGPTQLVETQTAAGTPLYRVMIGPIATRQEADAKAEEIAALGMAGAKVISALN